ncbi:cation:proton antiporter domain-containing protein [Nocardioides pacificus]
MDLNLLLVSVGALGLLVAALSARLRRLPLSEPLLALILGIALGREVTGALDLAPLTAEHASLHEGTRILLAVSVMAVALRYPVRDIRHCLGPVTVLLLVAMPTMAAVSAGLSWVILGAPVATALLVGAAVAPTDPVLASSVVTGEAAEQDLPARDREILSLESGANDGLALPLVLAALAVAGPLTAGRAITESLWQVIGAVVVGAALGWVGGQALRRGEAHGATAHGPALLFTVVLALAILGASGLLRTDGVLAVFVGGLAFNMVATGHERTLELSFDEAVNRFAVLPLFLVLGAVIPWSAWADLGWRGPALAVAVLLLRRLPVLLALARPLGLRLKDALYLGWFGPIGISALFYLTLEAKRFAVPETVLAAGSLLVVTSTVVHGITGSPGRALFRRA